MDPNNNMEKITDSIDKITDIINLKLNNVNDYVEELSNLNNRITKLEQDVNLLYKVHNIYCIIAGSFVCISIVSKLFNNTK